MLLRPSESPRELSLQHGFVALEFFWKRHEKTMVGNTHTVEANQAWFRHMGYMGQVKWPVI